LQSDQDRLARYVGLVNRGVLNCRRERYPEAVRDLEEAVKVYPDGVPGYLNLALALQGEKQWDRALHALDRAIELDRGQPGLYESRARLQLQRGERLLARKNLEEAVRLEPDRSRSLRLVNNLVDLGRLLDREQKYTEALAQYDRALRLRPDFVLAQRFRAETLLSMDRIKEAGVALDDYLKVTPHPRPEVYKARGLIYAGAGGNSLFEAIEMYTLALRQDPHDLETRCLRGWAHLMTDGLRLALRDFEDCLHDDASRDEQNARHKADALAGRGNARIRLRGVATDPDVRLKLLAEAVADAEAAQKQGQASDRLLYNIACIYAQAATQLEAEAKTGRDRLLGQRQVYFEEKALLFLGRVMEDLPEGRRKAFWSKTVESDPALAGIRRGRGYFQLAQRFGRPQT
jgi:tetratricopeptide (TPR) repeat protein